METKTKYSYFKMTHEGEILGIGAVEAGSPNEIYLINSCIDRGINVEKATKEEYESFEGDEIKNN